MSLLKNLKDPITDIIGLAIMVVTIYLVVQGKMPWQWEGLTGLAAGAALFIMPDDFIVNTINRVADKFLK